MTWGGFLHSTGCYSYAELELERPPPSELPVESDESELELNGSGFASELDELEGGSDGSELPVDKELSLELGSHDSLELEQEELSDGSELPLERDEFSSSRLTMSPALSLAAEEYVSPIYAFH